MGDIVTKLASLGLLFAVGCGAVKDPPANVDAPPQADAMPDSMPSLAIQIAPEMPRTLDDLVATVVGEAPPGATFRWSENATERTDLTTATIANAETAKGEVWKVELVDAGTVVASAEVTILNTAPTAPTLRYSSTTPTASLQFQCLIATPSTDDDGDTITYAATWTNNGAAFASTSTTTFPADTVAGTFTKVADVFHCTVAASDGTDSSTGDAGNAVAMACRVYATSTTLNPTGTGPTGTVQTFTVPAGVCSVRIEVAGAKGGPGTGSATNTNGARMIGTFAVTEGTAHKVIVGQQPTGTSVLGGGGGTFVTTLANAPLIIAGGGGSNGCFLAGCTITDAELMGRIVTSGGTAGATAGTTPTRADNGQGGNILAGAATNGGGGLLTNGAGLNPGVAFVNGGAGGGATGESGIGGYGGAGGRSGSFGEGGGGGYSGGSCGNSTTAWFGCGGGGSINMGTAQANTAGINAGAGYARFTY